MASRKLTLVIESARPEQEHVSLKDFLFQLTAFRKILSNTEALVAKREPVIDWQIIDLSQSSPAQVVLRSVHTDSKFSDVSGETVEKVFRLFGSALYRSRSALRNEPPDAGSLSNIW